MSLREQYQEQYDRGVVKGELIRFDFHPNDKTQDTFTMLGEVETSVETYIIK